MIQIGIIMIIMTNFPLNRRSLAKAITAVESQNEESSENTQNLLQHAQKLGKKSLKIGFSGPPGVGKSTLIEALGLYLADMGKKIAVLAIDPSSPKSGGSILGDKTRMQKLSMHKNAFIRPTAAGTELGGLAKNTAAAITLCEASDYDVIFVETVGVGQSEAAVAKLVDVFVFLIQPGSGDELQATKRGSIELANIIVVNKADGALEAQAKQSFRAIKTSLNLSSFRQPQQILMTSAINCMGIEELWRMIDTSQN